MNRIADDREGPGDTLLPLFIFPIFFIVFLIGPVSIPRFIQLLRDRRIFRKGKLTNAFVLFVRPRGVFSWFGWSGLYSANVYVRFQLGFGDYAEVKTVCKNDWLLNHLAPDALVHIVYLPNRPSRAVLLETYVRSPSAGFLLG